ncbi:MAG: DUF302 domain-containing protein [Mycobacterium sp.]
MTLAISTTLHTSFDEAVVLTRKALAEQGFGVLTEGNPALAHRAVSVDRQIGPLLPCNVVVRSAPNEDGTVIVDAMDPQIMVQVADQPGLRESADEAAVKLHAAMDALTAR